MSSSSASKFHEMLKSTLLNRGILVDEQEPMMNIGNQVVPSSSGCVQRIPSTSTQNVLDQLKQSLRHGIIEKKRASLSTTSDFELLYRSLLCKYQVLVPEFTAMRALYFDTLSWKLQLSTSHKPVAEPRFRA